jgi:5-methyltetrahydrofolate--homocysteine methyltransferase
MAFDEVGQADNYEDVLKFVSVRIIRWNGFPPQDIIFDLNIFPVATGMEEHRLNALDFLEEPSGFEKIYHTHISVVV